MRRVGGTAVEHMSKQHTVVPLSSSTEDSNLLLHHGTYIQPQTRIIPVKIPSPRMNIISNSRQRMKSLIQIRKEKYVGLKNLGCTCYLNAIVQAFYMIPRFRYGILQISLEDFNNQVHLSPKETLCLTTKLKSSLSSTTESLTTSNSQTCNTIYELQLLFAHLQSSARPYYNPKTFINVLKTWEGEPINLSVQQDASEFLTAFLTQIETELNSLGTKNNETTKLLSRLFGGVFSNELIAEGNRYSERSEPFHFISLPVRDRKTLKESLDAWVEGEKVSYTWENENGENENNKEKKKKTTKVTLDTHKRISIDKLPAQLIIHLKRFEFDFELMQQTKLHDFFEFPMTLDMFPYTKEGQAISRQNTENHSGNPDEEVKVKKRTTAPEYSQYELVGTVVHQGSAQSGHYYSILREQGSDISNSSQSPKWYEFNDITVTSFDPMNIPAECFGGVESKYGRNGNNSEMFNGKLSSSSSKFYSKNPRMKNRSSYILFYSRITPKLQFARISNSSQEKVISFFAAGIVLTFCSLLKMRSKTRMIKAHTNATQYSSQIQQHLDTENRRYLRKNYLYDSKCLRFTHDLIQSCQIRYDPVDINLSASLEARFKSLQVSTKFISGRLWHGCEMNQVLEWKRVLVSLYFEDWDGCQLFLKTMWTNESLLLDLLVFSGQIEIRTMMKKILSEAIISSTKMYENRSENIDRSTRLPASFDFILRLAYMMPALLSVSTSHHEQYFRLLLDFAKSGHNECAYFVRNGVIGVLVSLLTGLTNSHEIIQECLVRYRSTQILKRIDMSSTVLRLLLLLIRFTTPPAIDTTSTSTIPHHIIPTKPIALTDIDQQLLCNERFITILSQRPSRYSKDIRYLEYIVAHIVWDSYSMTRVFFDTIMKGIESEDHYGVKPYFRTFSYMLKCKDSLQGTRVRDGMKELMDKMISQNTYYKATETSIDMLLRLAKRNEKVLRWLRQPEHEHLVSWMEKWLTNHIGPTSWLQMGKTYLVKPNTTSSWIHHPVTDPGLIRAVEKVILKILPRLENILDRLAVVNEFYDSDDNPQRLIGKRVTVKWAKESWYSGIVKSYDGLTNEHFVHYDDGDQRNYVMSDKIFYVVNNDDATDPRTTS